MRFAAVASRVLGLALLAGATGGCECPPDSKPIPAGEVAPHGIDPQRALDALPPQTLALWWLQTDQMTTLTITTLPSVEPSSAIYAGCDEGGPSEYDIRAILMLESGDGLLRGRATTVDELEVSASGELAVRTRPVWITLPASILVGTGVAADPLLEQPGNKILLSILLETGTKVGYGSGGITLTEPEAIGVAQVTAIP